MHGLPSEGLKYYQEYAEGLALDRCEIKSMTEKLKVPAGSYDKVIKIEFTSPLEPGDPEYKYFEKE